MLDKILDNQYLRPVVQACIFIVCCACWYGIYRAVVWAIEHS